MSKWGPAWQTEVLPIVFVLQVAIWCKAPRQTMDGQTWRTPVLVHFVPCVCYHKKAHPTQTSEFTKKRIVMDGIWWIHLTKDNLLMVWSMVSMRLGHKGVQLDWESSYVPDVHLQFGTLFNSICPLFCHFNQCFNQFCQYFVASLSTIACLYYSGPSIYQTSTSFIIQLDSFWPFFITIVVFLYPRVLNCVNLAPHIQQTWSIFTYVDPLYHYSLVSGHTNVKPDCTGPYITSALMTKPLIGPSLHQPSYFVSKLFISWNPKYCPFWSDI